jgi:hypothetical protein
VSFAGKCLLRRGSVNAFSHWKPGAVRIRSSAEHVVMFQKSKMNQRQYCAKCSSHLITNSSPLIGAAASLAKQVPVIPNGLPGGANA